MSAPLLCYAVSQRLRDSADVVKAPIEFIKREIILYADLLKASRGQRLEAANVLSPLLAWKK